MKFIKIKVKPHQTETTLTDLVILMWPFTFFIPNDLHIICHSNHLIMNLSDERYSRNESHALN